MKKQGYFFLTFLFLANVSIFSQHIPPCQGSGHGTNLQGACWGYAVGKTFNRGWDDTTCAINTLTFNTVSEAYFTWYSPFDYSAITPGDIIAWGGKGSQHVAYVTSTYNGIVLSDRQNYGSRERTGLTLSFLIDEQQGSPTGYFRKKKQWSITVENDVEGSYNVGKVGINFGEYDSPKTVGQLDWESYMTLDAVFDGTFYNGYVRRLDKWTKDGASVTFSKTYNFQITDYAPSYTYKAVFKKQFDITVHNNFIGVGDIGVININSAQYNTPVTVQVKEGNNLTIEAPDQIINSIQYSFVRWDDNITQNPRTYTNILSAFSAIAYYKGKPTPTPNVRANSNIIYGDPIKIIWDEHPNVNVTQYYLYRKVKHSKYYSYEGPTLLATLPRGTRSYTDYDYVYTDGYTDDLLWYDVRAFYNTEQTFADSNYTATFGYGGGRIPKANDDNKDNIILSINDVPDGYNLAQNYPNPFNPTTEIYYSVKEDGFVTIKVYDVLGRAVATLVNENKPAGFYLASFNASDLPSGVYFYSIKTGNFFDIKKMILAK